MKFQRGDKVEHKADPGVIYTVEYSCMFCNGCGYYSIQELDNMLDGNDLELAYVISRDSLLGITPLEIQEALVDCGEMFSSETSCTHNIKEYFGLNERYNFCTKCSYTDRK